MKLVLAYLRNNWLALLIIVVAILWWQIIDLLTSPNRWNPTLTDIDYWSLVTEPTWKPFAVYGFFGFAIFAGLLAFFYIVPNWKVIYRLIFLVAVFLMCTLSTLTSHSIRIEDTRMNHIMSVNYRGNAYHLASYQSVAFLAPVSVSYYVFQCDSAGNTCSKIFEVVDSLLDQINLIISDNKLLLDRGFEQIQILPATN